MLGARAFAMPDIVSPGAKLWPCCGDARAQVQTKLSAHVRPKRCPANIFLASVPLVMGRNTLDAFHQQIGGRRVTDIAKSKDADHPFALVDHRQPADLQLVHVPYRLGEVIVITATM